MMSKYSSLLCDRTTITALFICLAAIAIIVAVIGIPNWTKWVIAAILLFSGLSLIEWRRRKLRSLPLEEQVIGSKVRDSDPNLSPEEVSLIEDEGFVRESEPEGSWKVIENSVRRTNTIAGEGPIISIGLAEVETEGDDRYKKLYFCKFVDISASTGYSEFRVPPILDNIVERNCSLILIPGNITVCERSWSIASGKPLNNILCVSDDIKYDMWRIISSSESIVFFWTDKIRNSSTKIEYTETYRVIVPVTGLTEVENRLSNFGSNVFFTSVRPHI